jgi:hypothetical protein
MVTGKGHGDLSQNRKRRVIGINFADKGQRRRAARFHRRLHGGFYLASSPVALRPPHPWPKAGRSGVASSLFCFERDLHGLNHPFQKAKLLRILNLFRVSNFVLRIWIIKTEKVRTSSYTAKLFRTFSRTTSGGLTVKDSLCIIWG